jgi:hypothetical protein
VLSLRTGRDALLQGGTLDVFGSLQSEAGHRAGDLVGTVVAPNGRMFDLSFAPLAEGQWKASAQIDAAAGAGAGLWEVHTTLRSSDGRLQRDARTAFAASVPTARFGSAVAVQGKRGEALQFGLPVEVASASRYDASAVLYASAADGSLAPIAIAHSAAWLEPGTRTLALRFDASLLAKAGFGAPYELRELRLVDQGSLGLMEHRARALRID